MRQSGKAAIVPNDKAVRHHRVLVDMAVAFSDISRRQGVSVLQLYGKYHECIHIDAATRPVSALSLHLDNKSTTIHQTLLPSLCKCR